MTDPSLFKFFLKCWSILKLFNDAASTTEIYDTPWDGRMILNVEKVNMYVNRSSYDLLFQNYPIQRVRAKYGTWVTPNATCIIQHYL